MELFEDRVQWSDLVLNLRVMLPESKLFSKMELEKIGCECER
jgi:hypothetical protein